MKKRYELQLQLEVDDGDEQRILEAARECYAREGARRERAAHRCRELSVDAIPPAEFIEYIEDALLELAENLFHEANVELHCSSCGVVADPAVCNRPS